MSSTNVLFYRVDLVNTDSGREIPYTTAALNTLISTLKNDHGREQSNYYSVDLSPLRDAKGVKPKETLDFFEDDMILGRLCRKKPNNQIIKRNYDTLSADSVFNSEEESLLGIEEYSFFLLDPQTGIMAMAYKQGAPSQMALTFLSQTFELENTMKFTEIPNSDGVRVLYDSSSPEISRLSFDITTPDAEFLQRVLGLPDSEIMELIKRGTCHASIVLKPEPRTAILKGQQEIRGTIDYLKNNLGRFERTVVRGKSNSFNARDFDLMAQYFSYPIDISKTHIVNGQRVYYSLEEIVAQYRQGLHHAYDENRDYVLHLAGRWENRDE